MGKRVVVERRPSSLYYACCLEGLELDSVVWHLIRTVVVHEDKLQETIEGMLREGV